jgi:asparagine synthetase B (glutamine-hydrolysing)
MKCSLLEYKIVRLYNIIFFFVASKNRRDSMPASSVSSKCSDEVHERIVKNELFRPGEYLAVAASGGKDSTVLAYIMKLLNDINERHSYGLKLVLLSVDEGITGNQSRKGARIPLGTLGPGRKAESQCLIDD